MPPVGESSTLPTMLVTFLAGGHQALINVRDFNEALHAPVEEAPSAKAKADAKPAAPPTETKATKGAASRK